jgi:hypothetical protein
MQIGQEVFVDFSRFSSIDVRKGTVKRITPSGQAVIDFGNYEYKFRDGLRITSDKWHKARIIDAETASAYLEEQHDRQSRKKMRNALDDIKLSGPKDDIIAALQDVLKIAEGLLE